MQLGSCIAVAVVYAGSHSYSLTPSLGTFICHRCGPKKTKQTLHKLSIEVIKTVYEKPSANILNGESLQFFL